jgi:hypothetical protein
MNKECAWCGCWEDLSPELEENDTIDDGQEPPQKHTTVVTTLQPWQHNTTVVELAYALGLTSAKITNRTRTMYGVPAANEPL